MTVKKLELISKDGNILSHIVYIPSKDSVVVTQGNLINKKKYNLEEKIFLNLVKLSAKNKFKDKIYEIKISSYSKNYLEGFYKFIKKIF